MVDRKHTYSYFPSKCRVVDGEFVRTCKKCNIEKSLVKEFYAYYDKVELGDCEVGYSPSISSKCTECCVEDSRLIANGKSLEEKRSKARKNLLSSMYNITEEDYSQMIFVQNGVCAICNLPETIIRNGKIQNLSVDHDHKTGRVRGLLCAKCNYGIGYFMDNKDLLMRAIQYLSSNEEVESGKEIEGISDGGRK